MIGLLDPRILLAAVIALAGAYGTGRWHQWRVDEKAQALVKAEQADKARGVERDWQAKLSEVRDAKDQDLKRIALERDRALAELRKRPTRMPEAARSSGQCDGATGRELSAEDAEAFARLAADADETAAALRECQGWVRSVTGQ